MRELFITLQCYNNLFFFLTLKLFTIPASVRFHFFVPPFQPNEGNIFKVKLKSTLDTGIIEFYNIIISFYDTITLVVNK